MDNALRNISLSLRTKPKASRANTKDGGVDRSREAVRKWIHRFGSLSLKLLTPKASRRIAVVDETCIRLGRRKAWLWIAIDPYNRAFLAFQITPVRNVWTAYSFLRRLRRRHGVRIVVTDGATWYPSAACWARLRHVVLSGGMRSYAERLIECLKDRMKGFDVCFPRLSLKRFTSAISWISAWLAFYNYVRTHLSLGFPPLGLEPLDEFARLCWLVCEVMHIA